jgi:hypothetical protein
MEKPRFEMTFEVYIHCAIKDGDEKPLEKHFRFEGNNYFTFAPGDEKIMAEPEASKGLCTLMADFYRSWSEQNVAEKLPEEWDKDNAPS